ncbi:hypothetical protein [Prosthecobacter vanneervenii]|uniref:Transmembrane protein n=1 Tax=Prosthecobacter vanneervenii TaxID=48466 RepID=A0A7W8DJW9_9BACT|nr:hypothetical protein [Prosthecobacter vanneervenii]MBB5032599.1 hypothetical protein [Prosthecobacter vanneervenii]
MKTFLRKMKLSFLAMLCGWIACNIAWWAGAVLAARAVMPPHTDDIVLITAWTAIVVLAAWLAVFLPVDLCVNDRSKLRRPLTAALCGFLSAFIIVAGVFAIAVSSLFEYQSLMESIWRALDKAALPYALGTCATGTVAAWTRALMDKPNRNQIP